MSWIEIWTQACNASTYLNTKHDCFSLDKSRRLKPFDFGLQQITKIQNLKSNVKFGGADPCGDGAAIGY